MYENDIWHEYSLLIINGKCITHKIIPATYNKQFSHLASAVVDNELLFIC